MKLPIDQWKILRQGKAVAERDGNGWLLMLPDGAVSHHRSRKSLLKAVNDYLEANLRGRGDIGIGTLEWRR